MTANNPYPMPFLMSADRAAEKITALIARGREFAVIPWQMAVIARLMRLLPNWLYDRLAADRGRKPRRGS
jgi:short-subunit dehydrogenase